MSAPALKNPSTEDRAAVRERIEEAAEAVSQFWPMRGFVHHNPLHGFEHLPFDQAIREAQAILGGRGYLPNEEYRRFYRSGRITDEGVARGMGRVGPSLADGEGPGALRIGEREVTAEEVWRLHLLFGLSPIPHALRGWTLENLGGGKAVALWEASLAALGLAGPEAVEAENGDLGPDVALPPHRALSDWLETLTGEPLVEVIDEQIIKWVGAFVDEGMADWAMPARDRGFYASWRDLARRDLSGRLLGIRDFGRKVRDLPEDPEDAILGSLERLGIPEERRTEYLGRQLAQLPGWTGFVRWRGGNPAYPAQRAQPIDLVQYLAVRLFFEVELVEVRCRGAWGIAGTLAAVVEHWSARKDDYAARCGARSMPGADPLSVRWSEEAWPLFRLAQELGLDAGEVAGLSNESARTLLGWLRHYPEEDHGPVWLEALEDGYREKILTRLRDHDGKAPDPERRPRAQIVLCIDVRSESFRRHVEAAGPYDTFGFAGFFGVPIDHQAFDTDTRVALCPVLLTPGYDSDEAPRGDQPGAMRHYAAGTRWQELGKDLLRRMKASPLGSLVLVDLVGPFAALGIFGKTLIPRLSKGFGRWFGQRFEGRLETEIQVVSKESGQPLTDEEQANFVEGALRTMGLTKNFGRLIVACGHGSDADNNPYFGALHCGACGGNPGDPNGRVFARMANNPEVRRILEARGLGLPEDTWFIGGKHDTTTDTVSFYDEIDVPASHAEDLRKTREDLRTAKENQSLERCQRLPGAPKRISPAAASRHVDARSADWANPRPEWGLAGNAAFLVGGRHVTRELDLEGRVFLHSYNHDEDPDGEVLTRIMTAPLVVGEWISMEHYFSGVDVWTYGSGSKVIHNVASGIGLMLGRQGDLATGLPLQTVNDGALHYHEPVRLLTIIEAPPERIGKIISEHDILQQLLHNGWVNLVALDPGTRGFHRYGLDASWEPIELVGSGEVTQP